MITLQRDYITDETLSQAYPERTLRDELRDLVLSGFTGLQTVAEPTPVRDYEPYRTTDFPNVLSLPLTDKLAPVYAPTSGDIQYDKSKVIAIPNYIDAEYQNTVLTNPAAVSLETVPVYSGSALEANYQQLPATLSGQDSMLVPMMNSLVPQSDTTAVDDSELLSTSTTANECWIPGITKGCWLRKDVRNETMVFIVGAIILAIGIFALTR